MRSLLQSGQAGTKAVDELIGGRREQCDLPRLLALVPWPGRGPLQTYRGLAIAPRPFGQGQASIDELPINGFAICCQTVIKRKTVTGAPLCEGAHHTILA